MIKYFKQIALFVFLTLFLSACQSVQDGLSGNKQNDSDEFLIKKKTPLILPPDYNSLPVPKDMNSVNQQKKELNIKEILEIKSDTKNDTSSTQSKNVLLEESIIKKIKNR